MAFHPVNILIGDVRERLRELPEDSFDCVVTSPPYWGLRDYGVAGQIGLEPTMGQHLAAMVVVFREVRRVLKPTGTLWLNYGDCYASSPNGRSAADGKALGNDDRTFRDKPISTIGKRAGRSENLGNVAGDGVRRNVAGESIKAKDLLMLPNRLAIALQDDGWFVRSECVWGKPNAMPDSSGTQRPSAAHEKVFMLAKSGDGPVWRARDTGELSFAPDLTEQCPLITDPSRRAARWLRIGCYYDAEAVKRGRTSDEDAVTYRGGSYVGGEPGPRAQKGNRRIKSPDSWDTSPGGHGSFHREGREKGKQHATAAAAAAAAAGGSSGRRMAGFNARWDAKEKIRASDHADPRHAGHINRTGIEATPRGEGRLLRNFEPAPLQVWEIAIAPFKGAHFATFPAELAERCIRAGCPEGGNVLDPFGGAGTTGLVAWRLQRACTLIELSEEYADIARKRLEKDQGLFAEVSVTKPDAPAPQPVALTSEPLFGGIS